MTALYSGHFEEDPETDEFQLELLRQGIDPDVFNDVIEHKFWTEDER